MFGTAPNPNDVSVFANGAMENSEYDSRKQMNAHTQNEHTERFLNLIYNLLALLWCLEYHHLLELCWSFSEMFMYQFLELLSFKLWRIQLCWYMTWFRLDSKNQENHQIFTLTIWKAQTHILSKKLARKTYCIWCFERTNCLFLWGFN